MTDRVLFEKALKALEYAAERIGCPDDDDAIGVARKALRERLAQPEPPVLTGIDCSCGKKWRILNNTLTASEPETVMAAYKHQTYAAYKTGGEMKIGVVPEQEPVAWTGVDFAVDCTPPRREWVGLTDEEIDGLHSEIKVRLMGTFDTKDIYRALEAKLKEKNNG